MYILLFLIQQFNKVIETTDCKLRENSLKVLKKSKSSNPPGNYLFNINNRTLEKSVKYVQI